MRRGDGLPLLERKNYDDLRVEDPLVPRILIVVLVPSQIADWLDHHESHLELRRCGYWLSLRGLPASNNAKSQTVRLPRAQRFDVAALRGMMQRIGDGGHP